MSADGRRITYAITTDGDEAVVARATDGPGWGTTKTVTFVVGVDSAGAPYATLATGETPALTELELIAWKAACDGDVDGALIAAFCQRSVLHTTILMTLQQLQQQALAQAQAQQVLAGLRSGRGDGLILPR